MRAALLVSLVLGPILLMPTSVAVGDACAGDHVTVDTRAVGGRLFYVGADGQVWEETNGMAGLQCTAVFIGNRVVMADTAILA